MHAGDAIIYMVYRVVVVVVLVVVVVVLVPVVVDGVWVPRVPQMRAS